MLLLNIIILYNGIYNIPVLAIANTNFLNEGVST